MTDILADISQAYGSLSEPTFGFISQRLDEQPYRGLLSSLSDEFEVEETTDSNEDHAFILAVSQDDATWALELSVVAPYAVLARTSAGWDEILTATTPGLSVSERRLVNAVTAAKLSLLDQSALEEPVPLRLYNASDVRVYQALFTDTDILPWDKKTMSRLGLI